MTTDDQNDDLQEEPGRLRRMYEEEAKARAESDAKLSALERREAFRDAGLDLSKPLHSMAMKAYDGDFEPEKVKAYVAELGITDEPAPPAPEPPSTPDEQAAMDRIASAGAGEGQPPQEPDRRAQLQKELAEAAMRGKSIAELDRISLEFSKAGGNRVVEE